jgi:hypothetical protein
MTVTQDRFTEAKARMRAAQEEARGIARDAFMEGVAIVFAAHPRLHSFGWTQYTPYFNDGDTCVFGAHIDEPDINGEHWYEIDALRPTLRVKSGRTETVRGWNGRDETRDVYEDVANVGFDPELLASAEAARDFLRTFDENDFRDVFGDHVKVTVRRDGFDVDEHEHD